MPRLLRHFIEAPRPCPYLPDRRASLEVRIEVDVGPEELEATLERGWRRFGPTYFRPACATCDECVTLRVCVASFRPTKSQRRARKAARRLRRRVGVPVVDAERLSLYEKWHQHRERARGWEESPVDAERYTFDFAYPHPCVREVSFTDPNAGDRLVGVGIVDETRVSLSAVYFFWDPEYAPSSLGTAHIVMLIEEAAERGLSFVYLGYRVSGCASLSYKGRYRPHELLEGRPDARTPPTWRSSGESASGEERG